MQAGVNTIAIQGIDLQVVRQGTGRPLLLLHGGDGPQEPLPFFTRLAERFDVIAPTHPGFAGTAIPEHFDTLEDLVYLYLDLLDVLDLHDVILMGMSMGGWVAAEIAVRNTSRLSQIILVDAVGIKPGDRDTRDIADIFGLPAPEVAKLLFHEPAQAPKPGQHDRRAGHTGSLAIVLPTPCIPGSPTCTIRSCGIGCTASTCRPCCSGAPVMGWCPSPTLRPIVR